MGAGRKLVIVGANDAVWTVFCFWFVTRNLPEPPRPSDGIFISAPGLPHDVGHGGGEGRSLVAGVCIYPTDGPYAVVEHSATNPFMPLKLRYEAMLMGAQLLRVYGSMRGKQMLCFPRDKGVASVLAKAGFRPSAAGLMVLPEGFE